ncbi:fumarylacetoacetate hydrolase family protein [Tautonia plasticadhaerens]|uniref:Ureidoglycolate lyase n=1 Tax=Tautonia plasticadhaerens TaxID=2527974 RepID=A0A518H3I2_9BACT|nr:fumarylacetoacetate hydrolase family protein [Tautonia plasticadhaerens]QDV35405.1 Ureidoglycolate lyase [Tautonia plasticadhaerens]
MQLAKFLDPESGLPRLGLIEGDSLRPLRGSRRIATILHATDPAAEAARRLDPDRPALPVSSIRLLPPVDDHEIWAAGVTYIRSKVARQEESEQGGSFYDLVYSADRPELFFKATAGRAVGHGAPIRVRSDTKWSVPEPELALVLDDTLRLVGLSIGNDVSARDIEGRNPLYLPQAKVYESSCALGPCVTLISAVPDPADLAITLEILRDGSPVFSGDTSTSRLARPLDDLISWLGRDQSFPDGVVLLTGTGIVPPDEFSLRAGDVVRIAIEGLGTLENPVAAR